MNSPKQWTTPQVFALIVILLLEIGAVVMYLPKVLGGIDGSTRLCKVTNLRAEIGAFISPVNWYGIFSLMIVVYVAYHLIGLLQSKYPVFSKIKKYLVILVIGVVLLLINRAC